MARTSQRGSTQKKSVKDKGKALHTEKGSNRKFHIEPPGPQDLIRRVQLGLNDDQYEVLHEMMSYTNLNYEEYVRKAIIDRIGADLDGAYSADDPRRSDAFKRLGEDR